MLDQGKIMKFSDLDVDIQNFFFSTEDELAGKEFIFCPNVMSKKGILSLSIFITIGSTLMLFIGGILSDKISFINILKWTFIWFLFISIGNFCWAYPKYKNTSERSGYLLTDQYFIFFQNKDLVKILPLKLLDIIEDKHGFIFRSGSASFMVGYEFSLEKKFSEILAEIIIRKPEFAEILKKEIKT